MQTALVVGHPNDTVTTERDLRVRIQFPWQRGARPLSGGLGGPLTPGREETGHAPGDAAASQWVRVAQPGAGANWGAVFIPRVGTEVLVDFIEDDIDRPQVVSQLHNGQGAWNEKQTASQIIVDAVIGMIPLVGQGTAVRNLLAVGTGLADSPAKRENVWDWVLFAILLMALMPVIGGVLKGVGRLTLRVAREAAENSAKIAALADDIVALLNRLGHRDAVKWFRALDFMKYEVELVGRCRALCDTVILCIDRYALKFAKVLPQSFVSRMEALSSGFDAIKTAADKMIPQALKELNAYLKRVQAHIVAGGVPPPGRTAVYEAQTGKAVVTYTQEARLIESGAAKTTIHAGKHPQNMGTIESVGKVYQ